VLDLDTAFASEDFIDNAHLTPRGQQRLADVLTPYAGMVSSKPMQETLGKSLSR
jgi:hypothetical protein